MNKPSQVSRHGEILFLFLCTAANIKEERNPCLVPPQEIRYTHHVMLKVLESCFPHVEILYQILSLWNAGK